MHTDRAAVGALADDATDRLRHWLNVPQTTVTASVAGGGRAHQGAFGWINHTYESQSGQSVSQAEIETEIRDVSWSGRVQRIGHLRPRLGVLRRPGRRRPRNPTVSPNDAATASEVLERLRSEAGSDGCGWVRVQPGETSLDLLP